MVKANTFRVVGWLDGEGRIEQVEATAHFDSKAYRCRREPRDVREAGRRCAMTIRLTTAQRSALECAGLDLLYDGADALIDAAWNGRGDFVVTNETRNALVSALHEMSNAEDYVAERDGDRAARGASTALWHLARKINLIDFAR